HRGGRCRTGARVPARAGQPPGRAAEPGPVRAGTGTEPGLTARWIRASPIRAQRRFRGDHRADICATLDATRAHGNTGAYVTSRSSTGSVHRMSHLVEIVLDCRHASKLARFWEAALGWRIRPYDEAEVARLAALGLTPESDPTVAIDSPDGSLVFFLHE